MVLEPEYEEVKLEDLVCMENPYDVLQEVQRICFLIDQDFPFKPFKRVFKDIVRVFRGKYPGYQRCNTFYHDLKHTTDCLLAMARLVHGASLRQWQFTQRNVALALVAALMHDTGYIQTSEDNSGTGAKYTLSHVSRSVVFMNGYFRRNGFPEEDAVICGNLLRCTGLDVRIDQIPFATKEHEIIGKMLGTADLIGQMADRSYLERLPFLYNEFREGKVPGFASEPDLLRKTEGFWKFTQERLDNELDGASRFVRFHLKARWGIDRDLYREAIERNVAYLKYLMTFHEQDYRSYLRRGGLMRVLDERGS
jgi:hypothetical protein